MGEARTVMDRVTQAMNDKDVNGLRELYAPDAVAETPDRGTIQGRDGIVEWMGEFMTAFPDFRWESLHAHEVGDTAIDEGYVVGTHSGPLAGPDGEVPATGRPIRMRGTDIATVSGGLITSHRFYFDQMDFLAQLGLLPET